MGRQPAEHAGQLHVAFGNRGLIRIVKIHGLFERKQMFLAPAALQRLDDVLFARTDAPVAQLRQGEWIAFPRQNGSNDLQSRLPDDAGDHVIELHVHLHQRLLHVLDMLRLISHQHIPLPRHRTQHADLVLRSKRPG